MLQSLPDELMDHWHVNDALWGFDYGCHGDRWVAYSLHSSLNATRWMSVMVVVAVSSELRSRRLRRRFSCFTQMLLCYGQDLRPNISCAVPKLGTSVDESDESVSDTGDNVEVFWSILIGLQRTMKGKQQCVIICIYIYYT